MQIGQRIKKSLTDSYDYVSSPFRNKKEESDSSDHEQSEQEDSKESNSIDEANNDLKGSERKLTDDESKDSTSSEAKYVDQSDSTKNSTTEDANNDETSLPPSLEKVKWKDTMEDDEKIIVERQNKVDRLKVLLQEKNRLEQSLKSIDVIKQTSKEDKIDNLPKIDRTLDMTTPSKDEQKGHTHLVETTSKDDHIKQEAKASPKDSSAMSKDIIKETNNKQNAASENLMSEDQSEHDSGSSTETDARTEMTASSEPMLNHKYGTRNNGKTYEGSEEDRMNTKDIYRKSFTRTYRTPTTKTEKSGQKKINKNIADQLCSAISKGLASVMVESDSDFLDGESKSTIHKKKYMSVDPRRIQNIQRNVPKLERHNFKKFKDALLQEAATYDWPTYIMKMDEPEWSSNDEEELHDAVRRKEAYAIIAGKLSDEIRDQVIDTEELNNAQLLYRKVHRALVKNTEDYALELESNIANAWKSGLRHKNIIEYGNFLLNNNNLLKEIGEGISEKKLVSIYRKGLPRRLEAQEIKLKDEKHIFTSLAKARELVETFCRDRSIENYKYPRDTKYDLNYKMKSNKKIETHNMNVNTNTHSDKSKIDCPFFRRGKCIKGDKCDMAHNKLDRSKLNENKNNAKSKPCMYFIKGKCNKGEHCSYMHNVTHKAEQKTHTSENKENKTDNNRNKKNKKNIEYHGMSELVEINQIEIDKERKRKRRKMHKNRIENRLESYETIDERTMKDKFNDLTLECNHERIDYLNKQIKIEYINAFEEINTTEEWTKRTNRIILDSGAMSHSTPNINLLTNIEKVNNMIVKGVGKHVTKIKYKGDLKLNKNNNNIKHNLTLKNVLVLPHSGSTIVSLPKLDEAGYKTMLHQKKAKVSHDSV